MKSVQTPSTVVIPAGRQCPRCGAALGGFGPEGLCGACLLDGGLGEDEPAPLVEPLGVGPRRFGDYELIEEIARGGMGVVFKARQISLNRIVAVKMILSGQLAGAADVQRFRREAEAAAHLHHSNIVAIHEVGECDGQHYFSMDYVEGRSLSALVRDGPLTAPAAARYVEKIARAVHYAHEHGVLHRDLKPSNVLLDAHDEPHVTDFGLAKRLNSELGTRNPELTLTGQVMGTPAFMPPEQATGQRGEMGPRSDVYSVGAILYHLLTGRPPFVGADAHAILPQVINAEPVAPRLLNPSAPRDLEIIALKCLEKEPSRRYASAQELALDLGRFLKHEPVLAQPPSALDRAGKFVRRHRVGVSVAACFVAVLTTATVVSITYGLRATQAKGKEEVERKRATHAEEAANKRAREALESQAESKAVLDFVQDHILAAARPVVERLGLGHDVTLRTAIEAAASAIPAAFTNVPMVESEIRRTLGATFVDLGDFAKAVDQFEQAIGVVARVKGTNSFECLELMDRLASAYGKADRLAAAAALMERVVSLRLAGAGERAVATISSVVNLASIQWRMRNLSLAMTNYLTAIRLAEEVCGSEAVFTLNASAGLANVYQSMHRYEEALALRRKVFLMRQATLGLTNSATLLAQANVAATLQDMGRLDEAIEMHLANLKIEQAVFEPDHPDVLTTLHNLGLAYGVNKQYEKALPHLQRAADLRAARLGPDHRDTLSSVEMLAHVLRRMGREAEAIPLFTNLLSQFEKRSRSRSDRTLAVMNELLLAHAGLKQYADAISMGERLVDTSLKQLGPTNRLILSYLEDLASAYQSGGQESNALVMRERLLNMSLRQLGPTNRQTLRHMDYLAQFCYQAKRFAESESLFRKLETAQRQTEGMDRGVFATTLARLAMALLQQGKYGEAETVLREATPVFERLQPTLPSTFNVYGQMGWALLEQRKHEEAENWLRKAHEGFSQHGTGDPSPTDAYYQFHKDAIHHLVRLYEAWGKPADAEVWRQKVR